MASDRETHSISFSDSLMNEVEQYIQEHNLKKCEFFEIATRHLLGKENAVPERLLEDSKSSTEKKLERLLKTVDGESPPPSSEQNGGDNNIAASDDEDGGNPPPGDEDTTGEGVEKPSVWGELDEDGRTLSWDEIKQIDEYVRTEDAWSELEVHPSRVEETKNRRQPVIAMAYAILSYHETAWLVEDHPADEVVTIRGVLSDVAPESTSDHSLFERSGDPYGSYLDELQALMVTKAGEEKWSTSKEDVKSQVDEILRREPVELADWASDIGGGDWASVVPQDVSRAIEFSDIEPNWEGGGVEYMERLEEYAAVRYALNWLDIAVGVDWDDDEFEERLLETRAVYEHTAKGMGGHSSVREAVADEMKTFAEYKWE
jgi:hypothetical protein